MKWQIIDNAPNSVDLLVFDGKSIFIGYFDVRKHQWISSLWTSTLSAEMYIEPTHWMFLPEEPKESE